MFNSDTIAFGLHSMCNILTMRLKKLNAAALNRIPDHVPDAVQDIEQIATQLHHFAFNHE